jgi:hypothetical protein
MSVADPARIGRDAAEWVSRGSSLSQSTTSASVHIVREVSVEDAAAIAHVYNETARAQYAEVVAKRVCNGWRQHISRLAGNGSSRNGGGCARHTSRRTPMGGSSVSLRPARLASHLWVPPANSTRFMCCPCGSASGWAAYCSIALVSRWHPAVSTSSSRGSSQRTHPGVFLNHSAELRLRRLHHGPDCQRWRMPTVSREIAGPIGAQPVGQAHAGGADT